MWIALLQFRGEKCCCRTELVSKPNVSLAREKLGVGDRFNYVGRCILPVGLILDKLSSRKWNARFAFTNFEVLRASTWHLVIGRRSNIKIHSRGVIAPRLRNSCGERKMRDDVRRLNMLSS